MFSALGFFESDFDEEEGDGSDQLRAVDGVNVGGLDESLPRGCPPGGNSGARQCKLKLCPASSSASCSAPQVVAPADKKRGQEERKRPDPKKYTKNGSRGPLIIRMLQHGLKKGAPVKRGHPSY